MLTRGSLTREPRTLTELIGKSDLLTLKHNGRVAALDRLSPVLDEYGVPKRIDTVRLALASVAVEHTWKGGYDMHHLAYEGRDYRDIVGPDHEKIGSNYRGAAVLKVMLPRQLHEYLHAVLETPPMPSIDVMRQYGRGANCVHDLFNTVRVDSYDDIPHLQELPFKIQEEIRTGQLRSKIEKAIVPEIGIVPDLELLSQLEISEARRILRSLARATGFSNVPSCQKVFFSGDR